ncbi:hypothetical protein ACFV30_19430 [Streptomyces sp. NPDC059752]|uniref:hypothetical protein n=1 Tax=unclassified Streptomyces TaxID=2593676 RepID=UPI00364F05F2
MHAFAATTNAASIGICRWSASVNGTWERPSTPTGTQPESTEGALENEPQHHALIHLAADGLCRTLTFHLTRGQSGDVPGFEGMMAAARLLRQLGRYASVPRR